MSYFEDQNHSSLQSGDCSHHECNVIFQGNFILDGKRGKRKREQAEAWKNHLERIELLAKPKQRYRKRTKVTECSHEVPLSRLMPRITILAQPKYVTPKYIKPVEEPFILPGKIKDWESHKKWLELRSQPKKSNKLRERFDYIEMQ